MSKMITTVMNVKNVLNKARCVVIGHMQYADGENVREEISSKLGDMGIHVFNHYKKPFITEFDESAEMQARFKEWLEKGEYDRIIDYSPIRIYDLALIDKCDFVIFVYDPDVITCGSWEEFFTANRIKRPIFFVNVKGKNRTPLWTFWCLKNHHYIYESVDDCIEMIKKIDSGEVPLDSDRWRLLRPEHR